MRRCLMTARGVLDTSSLKQKGITLKVKGLVREILSSQCDFPLYIRDNIKNYPEFDFSSIEPDLAEHGEFFFANYLENEESAKEFRELGQKLGVEGNLDAKADAYINLLMNRIRRGTLCETNFDVYNRVQKVIFYYFGLLENIFYVIINLNYISLKKLFFYQCHNFIVFKIIKKIFQLEFKELFKQNKIIFKIYIQNLQKKTAFFILTNKAKQMIRGYISENNLQDGDLIIVTHSRFIKAWTSKGVNKETDEFIDNYIPKNCEIVEVDLDMENS